MNELRTSEGSVRTSSRRSCLLTTLVASAFAALELCACKTELQPCNADIHLGQDLAVTVLGALNPDFDGPHWSCGGAFVTPGSELVIRPVRLVQNDSCEPYQGTFTSFGSFTFTDAGSSLLTGGDINYSGTLSKDGCSGHVEGAIANAVSQADSGPRRYGLTLTFGVSPGVSPETCGLSATGCYDEYAVHLSPKD